MKPYPRFTLKGGIPTHILNSIVHNLVNSPLFNFLSIISPMILSIVAILITILQGRRQNKIALYNLRYDALTSLRDMIVFGARIEDATSSLIIKILYDGSFGTRIEHSDEKEAYTQIISTTTALKKSTLITILAKKKEIEEIQNITYALQKLMIHVIQETDYAALKKDFCLLCDTFYNGTFKELCKKIKL